jgi:zinc transporter ZupT
MNFLYIHDSYILQLQLTFALPHTRRRWAFRAWAFGGGLAAVLCSAMSYFFLFFFVKTAFLLRFDFYAPLSIFANFDHFLPNISQNLF